MGMKRREVLKGLTKVAGGTLLPASAWCVLAQHVGENANLSQPEPTPHWSEKTTLERAAKPLMMSTCYRNQRFAVDALRWRGHAVWHGQA